MKLEISRQIYEQYSNIKFMKMRLLGAQLLHADRQTDGQT